MREFGRKVRDNDGVVGEVNRSAVRARRERPAGLSALSADPGRHLTWVREGVALAREQRLTIALLLVSAVATAPVLVSCVLLAISHTTSGALVAALGDLVALLLSGLMAYGCAAYLLARRGHLKRLQSTGGDEREYDPLEQIESKGPTPSVLALVPAYAEEAHIVRRALFSAALQPHVSRAVILIDDDPASWQSEETSRVRALPQETMALLRGMRDHCERALSDYRERVVSGRFSPASEAERAAELCDVTARWFAARCEHDDATDPAHEFFIDITFRVPSRGWRRAADSLRALAGRPDGGASSDRIGRIYERAFHVFNTEISSFERKRHVNLSHTPNKAMNINSYVGLMGGSYRYEKSGNDVMLLPSDQNVPDLEVPDADFLLILDADTIVAANYSMKLIPHFLQPGGERLAIVQSPYSTLPGSAGLLQRVAGAQTDVQYLVHQGLTHYHATFWVGANALIRVAALRDVATKGIERGYEIVKFIRDRTLIEDTESTIDLANRKWRLFNETQRLAFSVTPPDFGSLLVQRQRWASGGVLLVPKLMDYLRRVGHGRKRVTEGFMRLHYLISLGPVSMALLIMLTVAFDPQLRPAYLGVVGAIYYLTYARDLHLLGYHWGDVFRVMALNMLLIPVNIVGMFRSLTQAVTGRKPRFTRTPKVDLRTPVPVGFLAAEFVLLLFWSLYAGYWLLRSELVPAAFMTIHTALLGYAIWRFIGFRRGLSDFGGWLWRSRTV